MSKSECMNRSRFDQQPISLQLVKFSKEHPNFQKAWKIYENDKFRLLPAFPLISGEHLKDELIVNFFLNIGRFEAGEEKVVHTNVIVNEGFIHKSYTIYTGLPPKLRHLYNDPFVKTKAALIKRYPWLPRYIELDRIAIRDLPSGPKVKAALRWILNDLGH
jgi:hypothetical protein